MSVRRLAIAIPLAIAVGVPAFATPAFASGGGGGVRSSGACSLHSTWKLKAKPDNGRIQIEAEVDANRIGQAWAWRLADNAKTIASGTAKTVAPSGSFTVKRFATNLAGTDRITLRATNSTTGETCSGTVSLT
jgi:hypothetical protein